MDDKSIVLDFELIEDAQSFCEDLGTDVNTVLNSILKKLAKKEFPFDLADEIPTKKKPKYIIGEMGGMFPNIWVSDDFDEPMDWIVDEMD